MGFLEFLENWWVSIEPVLVIVASEGKHVIYFDYILSNLTA